MVIIYQALQVCTANPVTGFVDANGNPGLTVKPGCTLPGINDGALCGRIGTDGEVFLIGDAKEIPISSSGHLFLCINDDLNQEYGPGFRDNEGSINVSIDVRTD